MAGARRHCLNGREEAVRANRVQSRFLATARHDPRQPLQTATLLNAAMMRMTREKEIGELLKHQEPKVRFASGGRRSVARRPLHYFGRLS